MEEQMVLAQSPSYVACSPFLDTVVFKVINVLVQDHLQLEKASKGQAPLGWNRDPDPPFH